MIAVFIESNLQTKKIQATAVIKFSAGASLRGNWPVEDVKPATNAKILILDNRFDYYPQMNVHSKHALSPLFT